ncbi:hypothetical protein HG530_007555 [Fusarium avenaceum]|nr:hypothetical protein HG530_007555 [Fusarium avenaceum]
MNQFSVVLFGIKEDSMNKITIVISDINEWNLIVAAPAGDMQYALTLGVFTNRIFHWNELAQAWKLDGKKRHTVEGFVRDGSSSNLRGRSHAAIHKVTNSRLSGRINKTLTEIKLSRAVLLAHRLCKMIIRIRVDEDAPAVFESFDYLVFDKTVSLDNLDALTSQGFGLFGIRITSNTTNLEGLGLVLKEGLNNRAALGTKCTKDSNELRRRHDDS